MLVLACSPIANTLGLTSFERVVEHQGKESENRRPVKRALLVGINVYQSQTPDEYLGQRKSDSADTKTPSTSKGGGRAAFSNLDGPKTDIVAMRDVLTRKYGFTEIETLEDQKATRAAILAAIRKNLVDDPSPGDVCVFYYSGHGSRVRNSKGGELDGYDESIVPADSNQGALDIRDKELARLLLEALKKGVTITTIFDSCHSGSIGRGYPVEEKTRMLPYIETDIAEEPGFNEPPGKLGALILTASQDNEEAKERRYQGAWRGNFSWALMSVLNQPSVSVNESAERIFQRVTSFMRGEGVTHQPVLEGNQGRRKGPLFGTSGFENDDGPTASLVRVRDRVIAELQGGQAIGLSKGSELKKLSGGANEKSARLRITEVRGLNSAEAMVIEGDGAALKQGDLFVIDQWAAPDRADLKVWIPPSVNKSELARAAQEVKELRRSNNVDLIDDPTEKTPAYVVQYATDGWNVLTSDGRTQALGLAPALDKFASGLTTRSATFVNLPPSVDLKQSLKLGPGTRHLAIEITKSPQEANYILAGRVNGNSLEYAWIRPGVTNADNEKGNNPLPIRTDWTQAKIDVAAAAQKLEEQAITLSRIRGWLEIQASSRNPFPYTLALRRSGTDQIIRQGAIDEGKYDLVLVSDDAALKRLQDENKRVRQQRVYVFTIDSHGDSTLLFNQSGDVENLYPLDPDKPPMQQPRVILLGRSEMIGIDAPFGLDTYILLASEERIPDPFILEFKGVVSRGQADTQLARLLMGIGTASRAAKTMIPLNWSLDRMFLRSVGKSR